MVDGLNENGELKTSTEIAVEKKLKPRQRFKEALRMLGKKRPYIRGIVSQCKPAFKKEVPTACLMIRPSRKFKMYFNPEFIDAQRYTSHVAGVINHEIHHLIRGHLTIDRTGLDPEVLNLALEVHANMDIPRVWLPPQTKSGEALTHEHFNIQADVRGWKDIYAVLFKKFKKKKKRSKGQQKEMNETGIKKIMKGGGTGHSEEPKIKGKASKKLKKALKNPSAVKNMIAKLLNKTYKETVEGNEDDWQNPVIVHEEIEMLKDVVSEIPGILPGFLDLLDIEDGESKINWRQHLRNFIASVRKRSSSYAKPNKRFPGMMGIIPGRDLKAGRCNIFIMVDTSGSCVQWVPDFLAEMKKLNRYADGICVEWDAKEMDAYKLNKSRIKDSFRGGGGTDFTKCLIDENLNKTAQRFGVKPFDGIVVLTDLWATLPKTAPNVPLMWFITPNNNDPKAPFGKIIKI